MSIMLGTINIIREMNDEGESEIRVQAFDNGGEMLGLVESLGMLELAKDTVMRVHMGEFDDEEEE